MDELFENQNKDEGTVNQTESSVAAPEASAPVQQDNNAGYTPQFSYAAPAGGFDAGLAPQKKSKAPVIILAVVAVIILAAAAVALLNLNLIKAKINPEAYLLSSIVNTSEACGKKLEATPLAMVTNDETTDINSDIKMTASIEDLVDMKFSLLAQYDADTSSTFGDMSLSLNDSTIGFESYLADDYITFGLDGLSGKYYGLPSENAASKLNEIFELGLSDEEIAKYDEIINDSFKNVDEVLEKEKNPYEDDFKKFVETTYNSCSSIVKPQVDYAAYPFDENGNVSSDGGKKDCVRIRYDMTAGDLKEMWSIIRSGLETDPAAKNYLMENAEFVAFLENMNYEGSEDLYEDIFIAYVLDEIDMSMEDISDEATFYADFFSDKNGCLCCMIIGADDNGISAGLTMSFGKNVKASDNFNLALIVNGDSIANVNCNVNGSDYSALCNVDNDYTTLNFNWNKDSGDYTVNLVSNDEYNPFNMTLKGVFTSSKESAYFTVDSLSIEDEEDMDFSITVSVTYESSFDKPSSVLDIKDWSDDDIEEIKTDISDAVMDFANQLN